jgi:hypothetical protein
LSLNKLFGKRQKVCLAEGKDKSEKRRSKENENRTENNDYDRGIRARRTGLIGG